MPATDLASAEATLAAYRAARDRVMDSAESVSIDGRTYSMTSLVDLERMLDKAAREVQYWRGRAAGATSMFTVATWRS